MSVGWDSDHFQFLGLRSEKAQDWHEYQTPHNGNRPNRPVFYRVHSEMDFWKVAFIWNQIPNCPG
jgi:hypothetical protein